MKKRYFWRVNCQFIVINNSINYWGEAGKRSRKADRRWGGGRSGSVTFYSAAQRPWQRSHSQRVGYLPLIVSLPHCLFLCLTRSLSLSLSLLLLLLADMFVSCCSQTAPAARCSSSPSSYLASVPFSISQASLNSRVHVEPSRLKPVSKSRSHTSPQPLRSPSPTCELLAAAEKWMKSRWPWRGHF